MRKTIEAILERKYNLPQMIGFGFMMVSLSKPGDVVWFALGFALVILFAKHS